MARTPGQRGRIGNWLVESRLARSWETQEKARREIQRLTGWRVPASVYAEWESGRRIPSDTNLDRLQDFYGTAPGQTEKAATTDEVAAAIDRQTEALTALLVELREERAATAAETARLLGLLGAALGLRADPGETPAEAEPAGAGDTRRGGDLRALLPQR